MTDEPVTDEPMTVADERRLLARWLGSVAFVNTGGTPVGDPEGEDDE